MGKRSPQVRSRFSLRAFWFVRGLNDVRSEEFAVPNLTTFRQCVRPYRRRQVIALYLDRDRFETGGVWAHFNGPRCWVTFYDHPGGTDWHARSIRRLGQLPDEIEFLIDNGQADLIHRSWTVSRCEGMQALEHFLIHGQRHPDLKWGESPDLGESSTSR